MLIQQYQNIIEELYCDLKEGVITDCFSKSVTSNDINDNLPQPEKMKDSKKQQQQKNEQSKGNKDSKHCLEEYKNVRIFLLNVLIKVKINFFRDTL